MVVSLISPFRQDRLAARARFRAGTFVEVFLDIPLAVCEFRDPKGHYSKSRAGELKEFTGISSAYEPPEAPEIHLTHEGVPVERHVIRVIAHLEQQGLLSVGEK